jgi:sugar-specific transcriptional regulator TrmB
MSANLVERGYVTVEEMLRTSGLTEEALYQAIRDLESVGFVEVIRGSTTKVPALVRRTAACPS